MDYFSGKRIVVIGLSTEGQDALQFLAGRDCTVIGADRRDRETLFSQYKTLENLPITFSLGKEYLSYLKDADIIIRTPGMALSTPELIQARAEGKEITSGTKLFFSLCQAPIIGVTGTKGKGTTSTLIFEMLKKAGRTAFLGGNVGTPLLSSLPLIKKDDWVVLELSSFQLEDLTQSPHIAVVLKTTQDHLANFDPLASNFHVTRDAYVAAKKNIVLHQKATDVVIVCADDQTSASFAQSTLATQYRYGTQADTDAVIAEGSVSLRLEPDNIVPIASLSTMKLLGKHNLENIGAATLAAHAAGISHEIIQSVAQTFSGLPYRLEDVGVKHGVRYINDSFSTTPETTIAAVQAFSAPIVLIVGGSEKGSDFTDMGVQIAASTVKVAIVIGQMTDRIVDALQKGGYKGKIVPGLTSMSDMVAQAATHAKSGDVVLLSPACASFGLFNNYKERGKQFMYEVSIL